MKKLSKNIKWSFDNMPEPYDKHLSRSIPLYKESQKLIENLSSYYVKNSDYHYEIGCANGGIIGSIAEKFNNFDKAKFVGIDLSKHLIKEAKKRYKSIKNLNFVEHNASKHNFKIINLAIIHYCLQFMPYNEKRVLLKLIYKKLLRKGAAIIFEKTLLEDSYSQEIFSGVYSDFKFENGYSADEVVNKSISLRSVMQSSSSKDNIALFKEIGFNKIYTFFKWGPFEGYLCIK